MKIVNLFDSNIRFWYSTPIFNFSIRLRYSTPVAVQATVIGKERGAGMSLYGQTGVVFLNKPRCSIKRNVHS